MRFSIIIPVYNVEKYIRRCMDSVMNQTFRDFEVIVVDDESPDNSMQIVEEFAQKYPGMIKMIHQKNTRQGGARNHGVREAQGEYLLFVDSDDYVDLKLLETVNRRLQETPCDILAFQHMVVTEDGKEIRRSEFGGLAAGKYIPQKDKQILLLSGEPWGKAYLRSFYQASEFAFPEKLLYEDVMTRVLTAKASEVNLYEDCLYYYVQSQNSSMRQKLSDRVLDILKITDLVLDEFHKKDLYEIYAEPIECALLGSIVYVLDTVNKADPKSPLQEAMVAFILEKFPQYEQNAYLDPDIRKAMELLCQRKFMQYHFQVIRYTEFKQALRSVKLIDRLNKLRRQILRGGKVTQ